MRKQIIAAGLLLIMTEAVAMQQNDSDQGMELPGYYPTGFGGLGTVQIVITGKRMIEIDATRYLLGRGVKISTLEFQYATLSMIKPGMDVGYLLSDEASNGYRVVKAIYELPNATVPRR
ncbi:MAG: hypothetical protein ABW086_17100 [Sedimenticola sp.]